MTDLDSWLAHDAEAMSVLTDRAGMSLTDARAFLKILKTTYEGIDVVQAAKWFVSAVPK